MIHKIHMGEMLPSVEAGMPYYIVGYMGSVHDYSDVVFPQDIRRCTKCHDESLASQADKYKNKPTMAACGSCHDNVDFATATNHPVVQLNDNNCSGCHIPSGQEFDISVTGAHTEPLRASTLPGLNPDCRRNKRRDGQEESRPRRTCSRHFQSQDERGRCR